MTRLELLKKEVETIKELQTLSFDIKARALDYYAHEIMVIETYHAPNPNYKDE